MEYSSKRSMRLASEVLKHMNFPIIGSEPTVAIDLDDTLAEYYGWQGAQHIGKPRENAIWALKCFKYNDWGVEIFTSRSVLEPIWKWVDRYAPKLVDRINESRGSHLNSLPDVDSHKPRVDLFIDDRTPENFGSGVDWLKIMKQLDEKGLLQKGLLPLSD
jgi:hypothetical protein